MGGVLKDDGLIGFYSFAHYFAGDHNFGDRVFGHQRRVDFGFAIGDPIGPGYQGRKGADSLACCAILCGNYWDACFRSSATW